MLDFLDLILPCSVYCALDICMLVVISFESFAVCTLIEFSNLAWKV
jgi:hypothetical protein